MTAGSTRRAAEVALSAEGLAMRRGPRSLFSGVALAVPAAGLLEVLGPNGVGKTTLLRGIAGLTPFAAGTLHWRGACVLRDREVSPAWRNCIVFAGHLPALKPALTAEENLSQLAFLDGVALRAAEVKAQIERVGLMRQRRLPVGRFSQGQLRRLIMARLCLSGKPVWLLDEPLTALDVEGVDLFADLLAGHLLGGGLCVATTHRSIADLLGEREDLHFLTCRLGGVQQEVAQADVAAALPLGAVQAAAGVAR